MHGISPGAYPDLKQYTTKFGKLPRLPVNRLSNKRAMESLDNTTMIPTHAISGSSYMRQKFSATAKKLDEGRHGAVYMVNSRDDIGAMFDRLTNTIVIKKPTKIPSNKKIVVKVMTIHDDERRLWTDASLQHTQYLMHLTRKTIRAQLKNKPYTNKIFDMQHAVTVHNFKRQPKERQITLIDAFVQEFKRKTWKAFLQKSALDATNHEYLMKSKPIEMKCLHDGELTLRARDVIPELYFAGSDIVHGVYVVAMSAESGAIKPLENFTSKNVAMLERALLTLAGAGIEHGDLHIKNIFVFDDTVKIIDFGMSAILPERFQKKARETVEGALKHLLVTKSWPEEVTNSIWYGTDGTMHYLNSYMAEKHGANFDWYNPSGKLLKLAKALSNKRALDSARYKLWTGLCVRRNSIVNLTNSPKYKNFNTAPRKRPKYTLDYGDL